MTPVPFTMGSSSRRATASASFFDNCVDAGLVIHDQMGLRGLIRDIIAGRSRLMKNAVGATMIWGVHMPCQGV